MLSLFVSNDTKPSNLKFEEETFTSPNIGTQWMKLTGMTVRDTCESSRYHLKANSKRKSEVFIQVEMVSLPYLISYRADDFYQQIWGNVIFPNYYEQYIEFKKCGDYRNNVFYVTQSNK